MKHLYGKNRPAQAGIPVAETGIPARRDGTKNVPPPYKQYVIKTIETYACRDPGHRPVPVNVPSRLSYKQALIHTMCALKIPTLVQNAHLHHLINILEQQTGMD